MITNAHRMRATVTALQLAGIGPFEMVGAVRDADGALAYRVNLITVPPI